MCPCRVCCHRGGSSVELLRGGLEQRQQQPGGDRSRGGPGATAAPPAPAAEEEPLGVLPIPLQSFQAWVSPGWTCSWIRPILGTGSRAVSAPKGVVDGSRLGFKDSWLPALQSPSEFLTLPSISPPSATSPASGSCWAAHRVAPGGIWGRSSRDWGALEPLWGHPKALPARCRVRGWKRPQNLA